MEQELVDITSEVKYVYLTIPAEYVCLYHKLLVYLADLGTDLIKDCQAGCNATNKSILNCWNMFQALCAEHALHEKESPTAKETLLYNYIDAQLELCYKSRGWDKEVYEGKFVGSISEDGRLRAVITCNNPNIGTFEVDAETGQLYRTYIAEQENNDVTLDDEIPSETTEP